MNDSAEQFSDQRGKPDYRPDIDGLRAVAVLGVVIYHAGFGLPGGFIGVDVFFVISGYLITGLILRDLRAGTFSLVSFWERRVRRILPASLFVMTIVLVAGYFLLLPDDYIELAQATIAQLAFCGNIFYWLGTDYFDGPAELKPLLHTWSLAVEEQFYLVVPVLLSGFFATNGRRMWQLLFTLALGSFLTCIVVTPIAPSFAFFLLPSRAWEMLAGSLLALGSNGSEKPITATWASQLAGLAALTSLVAAMCFMQAGSNFPGYLAAIPVACTVVLIQLHRQQATWTYRLLAHPWLVGIGLISYSLYLWHWPLMALTRYVFPSIPGTLMYLPLLASFPIAFASWKWIEMPLRGANLRGTKLFGVAATAMLLPLFVSGWVWLQAGLPERIKEVTIAPPPNLDTLIQKYRTSPVDFDLQELPILGDEQAQPSFLVWGDSHALALAPLIDEIASEHGISARLVARGGHPPLLGCWRPDTAPFQQAETVRWNQNVVDAINQNQWRAVIVIAAWQNYILQTGLENEEPKAEPADSQNQPVDASSPNRQQSAAVLKSQLQVTATAIREPIDIHWLPPAPRQKSNLAQAVRNLALNKWSPQPGAAVTLTEYRQQMTQINAAFTALEASQTRQPNQHHWADLSHCFFDPMGEPILVSGGEFCYVDDNHVSPAGAREYFYEALLAIVNEISLDGVAEQPRR
ncbi:MAG TPA: hypothetical protein DDW52_26460 [Planctomycetaceae bacterium]|nr:hypothetical protein [Planctomycetaceae bacterium]